MVALKAAGAPESTAPPAYAGLGSLVHETIARYYELLARQASREPVVPADVPRLLALAAPRDLPGDAVRYLENFAGLERERLESAPDPVPLHVEDDIYCSPFHGVVDLAYVGLDDSGAPCLVVVDWKTGRSDKAANELYRLQLSIYVYLLQNLHPELSPCPPMIGDLYRGEWIKIEPIDPASLLDEVYSLLGSQPEPRPGPHCERCPFRASCSYSREYTTV